MEFERNQKSYFNYTILYIDKLVFQRKIITRNWNNVKKLTYNSHYSYIY